MVAPLKVGLAGLGTVGASVVRLIAEQRASLAQRCGRPIEIVAVTARSRGKDRGAFYVADPPAPRTAANVARWAHWKIISS
jgi:homoserine dehydrogenase